MSKPILFDPVESPYLVDGDFKLRKADTEPPDADARDKRTNQHALDSEIDKLSKLQRKLYADARYAVLLIFQGLDASGKDGTIRAVMSGVNPQGCQVFSFKAPTSEELDHDYMWRCAKNFPERGRIGIFNRSYYEEVLVVKVHPEFLAAEKLPPSLVGKDIWQQRYEDIRGFERYLSRNGTRIVKFFLYVSRDEQKKRFLERIEHPQKNWKFSAADVRERGCWDDYMAAYQDMIRETASADAPWYVVPADNKWFTRLVVAAAIVDTLASLDLHYPKVTKEQLAALAQAKTELLAEKKAKKR
jgi:PPK2 family polyphosphate:nucleotide phosphotransferase